MDLLVASAFRRNITSEKRILQVRLKAGHYKVPAEAGHYKVRLKPDATRSRLKPDATRSG